VKVNARKHKKELRDDLINLENQKKSTPLIDFRKHLQLEKKISELYVSLSAHDGDDDDNSEDLTSALEALYHDVIHAVNSSQISGVDLSIESMLIEVAKLVKVSKLLAAGNNNLSTHDMAFINVSFATILWKQGKASNIHASFRRANSNVYVDCVLKLGQVSMHESIKREYEVMYELHFADPDHFIKPLAFLYGNQIHSNKSSSDDDDVNAYTDCVAIAMERGSCNLREYVGDGNILGFLELSVITRHMLDAVCAATRKGFVLLDTKLENFVRVTGNPDRYKAIDFESVVRIGEDISNAQVAVTYGYVSPEIAKIYLAHAPGSPTNKLVVIRADASS